MSPPVPRSHWTELGQLLRPVDSPMLQPRETSSKHKSARCRGLLYRNTRAWYRKRRMKSRFLKVDIQEYKNGAQSEGMYMFFVFMADELTSNLSFKEIYSTQHHFSQCCHYKVFLSDDM